MLDIRKNFDSAEQKSLNVEKNSFNSFFAQGEMNFKDAQNYWKEQFYKLLDKNTLPQTPEKISISEEEKSVEYYTSYAERLQQTPLDSGERGKWTGVRGESVFIPNDRDIKKMLKKNGLDGIKYENAIPDFEKLSVATLKIGQMTEVRGNNFKQCDEKCAKLWNKDKRENRDDWTPREVAQWRRENSYSWHERNDMKTCDLIPTKINAYFGHSGGVSECKKRDSHTLGGDFDE